MKKPSIYLAGKIGPDELRHQPNFPKPAYLTPRCPVWREAELQAWLDAKFAANREGGDNANQ